MLKPLPQARSYRLSNPEYGSRGPGRTIDETHRLRHKQHPEAEQLSTATASAEKFAIFAPIAIKASRIYKTRGHARPCPASQTFLPARASS